MGGYVAVNSILFCRRSTILASDRIINDFVVGPLFTACGELHKSLCLGKKSRLPLTVNKSGLSLHSHGTAPAVVCERATSSFIPNPIRKVEFQSTPLVESGISTTPAVVTSLSHGVPYGHREVRHENLLTAARDDMCSWHSELFCSFFRGNECCEHD